MAARIQCHAGHTVVRVGLGTGPSVVAGAAEFKRKVDCEGSAHLAESWNGSVPVLDLPRPLQAAPRIALCTNTERRWPATGEMRT